MQFKKVYRPEEGDMIRVKRKQGYAHFGIATSRNTVIHYSDFGSDSVLQASKVKIIETSLGDFLAGGKCEKVYPYDSPFDRKDVVARAKQHLGIKKFRNKTYNFVTNNCEHFASYIYYGVAESKQVQNATKVAVATVGIVSAAVSFAVEMKNKIKKNKQANEPLKIEEKK